MTDIGARAYNSGALTIANTTWTALTFDSERWDTDGIHDAGSNPSRLTCQTAGKYVIAGNIVWNNDATGIVRYFELYLNGTTRIAIDDSTPLDATNSAIGSVTTIYDLSVSDYVELRVYQATGGNLDIITSENASPDFMMYMMNCDEGARIYHSAAQEIPTGTWTVLTFDSERWDTDGVHDAGSNPSRLTCRTPGKYLVVGNVIWEADVHTQPGLRHLDIRMNGTKRIGIDSGSPVDASNEAAVSVSTLYDLSVGDYVELRVAQNSGFGLEIFASAQASPEFMMQRMGR